MVNIAEQKQIRNFIPIQGDITNINVSEKFDAVISLFHVISYLTTSSDLINCLTGVSKALHNQGIFIFDVWYTPAVYFQKPEVRIKRLENEEISVIRIAEPVLHVNRNLVDVNYEIVIKEKGKNDIEFFKERHPMRHFSIPEIELLAQHCGFELIGAEEFLSACSPSETTWGVCFMLRKK
jgi:predicted regulator of amino acid metabolism with ACT domain